MRTAAQAAAWDHPCSFAFETLHPALSHQRVGFSLVLSINTGYE